MEECDKASQAGGRWAPPALMVCTSRACDMCFPWRAMGSAFSKNREGPAEGAEMGSSMGTVLCGPWHGCARATQNSSVSVSAGDRLRRWKTHTWHDGDWPGVGLRHG